MPELKKGQGQRIIRHWTDAWKHSTASAGGPHAPTRAVSRRKSDRVGHDVGPSTWYASSPVVGHNLKSPNLITITNTLYICPGDHSPAKSV